MPPHSTQATPGHHRNPSDVSQSPGSPSGHDAEPAALPLLDPGIEPDDADPWGDACCTSRKP